MEDDQEPYINVTGVKVEYTLSQGVLILDMETDTPGEELLLVLKPHEVVELASGLLYYANVLLKREAEKSSH